MAEPIMARVIDEAYEWLDSKAISRQGNLQELAEVIDNHPVTLLLPATDVLLIELNLPISSQRQLQKALPFALEDYLAYDLEMYHWVWSKQPGDKVAVAAIAHEKLAAYLQGFNEADIKLQSVYAETLFLPVSDNAVSILLDRNHAIVRFSAWHGGGIDQDFLPRFIENTLMDHNRIHLLYTEPCAELVWPKSPGINSEAIPSAMTVLRPDKKMELNLLTGIYRPDQPSNVSWKAWIPAVALIMLAALIQYGSAFMAYRQSQTQLAELENTNRQLFKQTFPQIKRIVNIKTQAEQALQALRKQQGNGGSVYLGLLFQTGQVLSQDPSLQLQSLDYLNGILSLHLRGTGVAQIEGLKQQMEQNRDLKITLQSAETDNNGVFAHIDISGQSL
jgi:general secretion pathway protein L